MNEYEKHRRKKQIMNELQIKKMQDELSNSNSSLEENASNANTMRKGLGEIGQSMSTSSNTKLANAGSKLYKFTGQQGLDTLKNKAYNGISKGVNALKGKVTSFKGNPNSAIGQSANSFIKGTNTATDGLSSIGQTADKTIQGANATANTASTTANTASNASKVAGGASKALGAVGAGMNVYDSATKFAQGDAVGGGLSALKLASLAGGPIGWGIYALATIAEMFKGAQEKKQQKALSQTQEANTEAMMKQKEHQAEVMQDNAERKAEAVGEIESGTDVNSDMTIEPVNMNGQQNDINTPIAEETPVNEPANDVSEEGENKTMKDGILSSLKDFATGFLNHEAGTTGGTSPIDNIDLIADQEKYMKDNNFAPEHIKGLRQGLNYGNKEIADWIDQYNKGACSKDPIKIPKTEKEIALAKEGKFNPVPQEASVNEKKTLKDLIMQNIGDSLGGFAEGYRENRNNGFNPDNLVNRKMADGSDKTILNRAGEALGTLNRLATNPLLQGGLAGLAYGIDKGDALYGLGKGVEWAGNKAKSNMYSNKLGIQPTVLGNVTADDYKAMTLDDSRNKKLTQDGYLKLKKQAEDNLNTGRWNVDVFNDYMDNLNNYYMASEVATLGTTAQDSNQTRDTNSKIVRREDQTRIGEGQLAVAQQNANSNSQRANVASNRLGLDKEKFEYGKQKYDQKQIDKKLEKGDLVKVSHNGKTLIIPREQLKNAIKDGAKVVR